MIIFGAFGLLGVISSVAMLSVVSQMKGVSNNPGFALMQTPQYAMFMKAMILPTLVVGGLGIAAGIGLFKGREWARKGGLVWAVLSLVTKLASLWFSYSNMAVMTSKMGSTPGMKPEQAAMVQSITSAVVPFTLALSAVFAVALPVLLLVLLTRPKVVGYCKRTLSDGPPPLNG